MVPAAMGPKLWEALLQAGRPAGLIPAGLGARDTLRLEAGMRLHGNDIDDRHTVVEADLGWIVGWKKAAFLGRDVLEPRNLVFSDARAHFIAAIGRALPNAA